MPFTKGHSQSNTGRTHFKAGYVMSEEHKEKIRRALKGRTPSNIAILRTPEVRKKVSNALKGERSYLWRGGITPVNHQVRNSREYRIWRKSVFERDSYTCVFCGKVGGVLNADHIKPFAIHAELRFEISNGRTLCVPCHKTTETFAGKTKRCI